MEKILRPQQESEDRTSPNKQGRSMDQYKKGQNHHLTSDEDRGSSGSTGSQGGTGYATQGQIHSTRNESGTTVSGSNDSQSGSSTSR